MTVINLRVGSSGKPSWIFQTFDLYKHVGTTDTIWYPDTGITGWNAIRNSSQTDLIPYNIRYGVDICGVIGEVYFN